MSGLKVDAHLQIKFSRDDDGNVQPEVTKSEAKLVSPDAGPKADDAARPKSPSEE